MHHAQHVGCEVMIKPQAAATTASVTGIIDTRGASYLAVNFALDTQASATSKPQILKLQEADDTNATSFVDIKELVGDGADGFTIPDADTTNPQVVRLELDLIGRKRHIQAELRTGGATQQVSVVGELSRAADSTEIRGRNSLVVTA